jgi:hypothetical protein
MSRFLSAAALIFLFTGDVLAQDYRGPPWFSAARCSQDDAMEADAATDFLKDWAAIYRVFKRYAKCDDGAIAEGYSDAIVQLLALHWSRIGELSKLTRKDPMFEKFVLWHIDETASWDQEKMIAAHARYQCPPGLEELCKRLEKAAQNP